jgi:hypothetical protein
MHSQYDRVGCHQLTHVLTHLILNGYLQATE